MIRVADGLDPLAHKTRLKRRHIAAATIGNALEFYDFLIYTFFSIQIGHAFFPAQSAYGSLMLSLATFGAGFITRPIGAVVIGNYADRAGRRPARRRCPAPRRQPQAIRKHARQPSALTRVLS